MTTSCCARADGERVTAPRKAQRGPSAEDLLAEGHYLARRLEAASGQLRRSIGAATGQARVRLVRELGDLVDAAERVLGASR
jgi:hypothetical protein